jgi:hypothetical protein
VFPGLLQLTNPRRDFISLRTQSIDPGNRATTLLVESEQTIDTVQDFGLAAACQPFAHEGCVFPNPPQVEHLMVV